MIPEKIDRIEPDKSQPSPWSAAYFNQLVDTLNALRKMEVVGGKVVWSDANLKIIFSGSVGSGSSAPVSGSTFISSSVYCIARWT